MGEMFKCALHPIPGDRDVPCQDCSPLLACRIAVQEIAVVDDDPDQGWELADALTAEHRRIRVFQSAMETIRQLVTRAYDVLVSDIDMPEMNGLQLAAWVARESPRTRIILISGRVPDPALCSSWTFLPKPVSLTKLNAALQL